MQSGGCINRVPHEVLSRIFVFAVIDGHQLSEKSRCPLSRTFTLSMICSTWRNVAFSTPRLWTQILISAPPELNESKAKEKAVSVNTWIERSGSLPLTLYAPYGLGTSSGVRPIQEVIQRHADRCESILLNYSSPDSKEDWAGYRSRDVCTKSTGLDSPSFSLGALRRLYCCNDDVPFALYESIDWAQITHLYIATSLRLKLVFDILERCSNLIELEIFVKREYPPPSIPSPPSVQRDTLRKLAVHDIEALDSIFDAVTLPSLVELRLGVGCLEIDSFDAFLRRSTCKLDALKITGGYHGTGGLVTLLSHDSCQSLTGLSIECLMNGDDFTSLLEKLFIGPSNPSPLCPNLLLLKLPPMSRVEDRKLLMDMIESRLSSERNIGLGYLYLKLTNAATYDEDLEGFARRNGIMYFSTGDEVVMQFLADSVWRLRENFF